MNIPAIIFDILFVLIAAIFITVGVKRGFIKSLIQSAKYLLAIVITYFVAPATAAFVREKFIFQPVFDWLTEAGTNAVEKLPKFLRPDEAAITEEVLPVANFVSDAASNLIGYVVTFVLALIVLAILGWVLTKLTDKINFLGTANRVLGGVFGALMGVVVLLIIAVIVKFLDAEGIIYPDTYIVKFVGDLLP